MVYGLEFVLWTFQEDKICEEVKMSNVLVLVADYPNNSGGVKLMYVHTRNLYYKKNGINVTVLNFSSKSEYRKDGIRVINENIYKQEKTDYDILVLHAANIRNHYKFLREYGDAFSRFIFFYHGHEVMKINKDYCKPYPYLKTNPIKNAFQNIYDFSKLAIWKKYLLSVIDKSDFVFVSKWMYEVFIRNTKINPELLKGKTSITYNNVGLDFETLFYDDSTEKKYDFVTIRANLDGAKYCVDVVNRLAENSPNLSFLLVGKGEFFSHYRKAENLTWLNKTMSHDEIIKALNSARYALMPTRTDAQGLMMCEMAAFGIPVITSDIPVCHEVFDGFNNVFFISNDDEDLSLNDFENMTPVMKKDTRFYIENTVVKEVELIRKQMLQKEDIGNEH